ncbi:dolichyl-phosphate-mannose-protein mannosyltransferase [delta proteobacterium NaphS2]|nr:dolichyl-phosphate-mannose-protein mannosyltransferase [delta proteobacterium NaphS2]
MVEGAVNNSDEKSFYGKRSRTILATIGVLVTACILYFSGLGGYPLLDPDEGRYAEIPREMLESGDFITPRLNYVKYFEKPPLFYWMTAGSMALFGQKEWAVRLVPAVSGFLTLLLIMGLGKKIFDGKTGVMAGWIYLTSVIPTVLARLPIIDGFFTLILTATWATWYLGYKASGIPKKRLWYCISWACLGLAVMTKGIAAIALTGLIAGGFILCRRDWRALSSMAWAPGLLIFAIIVVPWHWAVSSENPGFFHFYIVVQHFDRLTSQEHAKPFWFFIALFPFGMLLWTAFFFPAVARSFQKAFNALRSSREDEGQGEAVLFLVIWIVAVIGLFSLSACKLVPYILPAYPAMALLMAHFLRGEGQGKRSVRWGVAILAILLMVFAWVLMPVAARQDALPMSELALAIRVGQAGLILSSILLAVSFFKRRLIPFSTGFAMVLLLPAMLMVVPSVAKYRKVGGFIKAMPTPLPPEIKVAEWRNYDQALSFYTGRRTILVDEIDELAYGSSLGNHEDYFLTGEGSLRRLAKEVPLLVNIRPNDWPKVQKWETMQPVAANSTNIMIGNKAFFRLTGLKPWPDSAIKPPPLLLMPRLREQKKAP